jgi:hypothetical protein
MTTIQHPEPTARALRFLHNGWTCDFHELLADALRHSLESHSHRLTESIVMSTPPWGLHADISAVEIQT